MDRRFPGIAKRSDMSPAPDPIWFLGRICTWPCNLAEVLPESTLFFAPASLLVACCGPQLAANSVQRRTAEVIPQQPVQSVRPSLCGTTATHVGVMQGVLADPDWNKQNPRWLPATVWSAQFAGYGWMQADIAAPGPHQCAACAAEIPEAQAESRCSKCKLVTFSLALQQEHLRQY